MKLAIALPLFVLFAVACSRSDAPAPAPGPAMREVERVKFETTKGDVVIEVHREWAPIGAPRFVQLVREGYYDGNRFFRVLPGRIAQWGLAPDPADSKRWKEQPLRDEPPRESNRRGTIVFAKTMMPNSRTTQLFVNLRDNPQYDSMGFAPIGRVVEGMEVLDRLQGRYGETPSQPEIEAVGNEYLDKYFPGLDEIRRAYVLE